MPSTLPTSSARRELDLSFAFGSGPYASSMSEVSRREAARVTPDRRAISSSAHGCAGSRRRRRSCGSPREERPEPGETIEQTALRELAEEVDGPRVYTLVTARSGHASFFHTFAGRETDLHEWYFVASVASSEIRDVRETGQGASILRAMAMVDAGRARHTTTDRWPRQTSRRCCPRSFSGELPADAIAHRGSIADERAREPVRRARAPAASGRCARLPRCTRAPRPPRATATD